MTDLEGADDIIRQYISSVASPTVSPACMVRESIRDMLPNVPGYVFVQVARMYKSENDSNVVADHTYHGRCLVEIASAFIN